MTYNIELCMKVNEKRWIESLRNGQACFNPVETFIAKAEKGGNNEQGDKYEGIFARIKANDVRLVDLRNRLGDDLEEIDDDGYVLLRRKSSRKVPIFCAYGIKRDELKIRENSIQEEVGGHKCTVDYEFPDKIYSSFLDCTEVWGFYASSGHFCSALEEALNRNHLSYAKAVISYDIDPTKEFYFEPDSVYSELNHKRKDLEYQHEIRYRLLDFPRDEKYLLDYVPLSEHSCGIAPGALRLEMHYTCGPTDA